MKLEDTIDKNTIVGIPSGEALPIENEEQLSNLRFKKLVWIKVISTNTFVYAFNDKNLNKIKKILK